MENPAFKTKLLFWLMLGIFSTFFAEVISGSTPFPFLPINGVWGILMVTPLYTTHILVFAYLVYRCGKPRFHTLYLAGALFGMYEAYATGVLWAGWGDPPPILLFEVGVIETLVLVAFWHPVFAFILPVILGETVLTRDAGSTIDVARLTTRKSLIMLAVAAGVFQSINMGSVEMALSVGGVNLTIVAALILFWRKRGLNRFSMQQLLPNKTQFRWILGVMISQYLFLGMLSAGKYPDMAGHIAVLALYILLTILFIKSLKISRRAPLPTILPHVFRWRSFLLIASVFVSTSVLLSTYIGALQPFASITVLLSYAVMGFGLFALTLRHLFQRS
ncbi:MAG: hypothetical protein JKY41_13275 [Rhodobacteraceae bacterium]|nr:hypothetical protein [Paracoccaceae bacterium]